MDEVDLKRAGLVSRSCTHAPGPDAAAPTNLRTLSSQGLAGHVGFLSPSKESLETPIPLEEAEERGLPAAAGRDELELHRLGLVTSDCRHLVGGGLPPQAGVPDLPPLAGLGTRGHVGFPSPSRESLILEYPEEAAAPPAWRGLVVAAVAGGGELATLRDPPRLASLLRLPDKLVYVERTPEHALLITATSPDNGRNWHSSRLFRSYV